jgi:hydroxymethylpyrimidine/phosphomethylpyrimidine kinase
VAPRIISAQIDSVMRDIGADACKIGMLLDARTVDIVAERIRRREIPNVVIDPVISAKDGTELLSVKGVNRMKRNLIPNALVVTPNVPEAEILSKISIKTPADQRRAAEIIISLGCKWVLIKGGHLPGEPVDMLFDGRKFIEFPGTRIKGAPVHGTGCAFSAAMAARIAIGDTVPDAALFSKNLVSKLIANAVKLGKGSLLIK